ncbi:unnamed protein product [Symbiodinium pilosum]|uniref:Uncharacterized protein n=1 Tax=Symbiodinium pilosum TaxID=2952 RepID=A0A812TC71_SYMPI|nr:unnamed protein product [Symbiodinium pilosum]
MFDEDDSQTFESSEFVEMISAFFFGIACAFGLLEFPHIVPKPSMRQKLGKHLFDRLVSAACCKITFWEAKKIKAEDSAPFWLIEEWFLGESGDPLSAPFAMFLERFSVRGVDDDPEFFEGEDRRFKLSHTGPVEPPLETAASLDSSLEEMEFLRENGQKVSLGVFLKKLCPNAKPRHLRMFQTWLKELDHIEELKVQWATARRMLNHFEGFIARPVLPARVRQELLTEHESIHCSASEARVMACAMRKKFFQQGSAVNKDDYIAAMCPTEFRPKEGNPLIDQVVGQLLRMNVTNVEESLKSKEALFASRSEAAANRRKFIKPAVPEHQWAQWNQAFDAFSPTETATASGRLSVSGFVRQNDVCPTICEFMCEIIRRNRAEGHEPSFSKEEFLQKMLEISACRVRKDTLRQGGVLAVRWKRDEEGSPGASASSTLIGIYLSQLEAFLLLILPLPAEHNELEATLQPRQRQAADEVADLQPVVGQVGAPLTACLDLKAVCVLACVEIFKILLCFPSGNGMGHVMKQIHSSKRGPKLAATSRSLLSGTPHLSTNKSRHREATPTQSETLRLDLTLAKYKQCSFQWLLLSSTSSKMFATCLQTLLRSQCDFVNEVDHWKLMEAKGAVLSALARWFLPGNHRQEVPEARANGHAASQQKVEMDKEPVTPVEKPASIASAQREEPAEQAAFVLSLLQCTPSTAKWVDALVWANWLVVLIAVADFSAVKFAHFMRQFCRYQLSLPCRDLSKVVLPLPARIAEQILPAEADFWFRAAPCEASAELKQHHVPAQDELHEASKTAVLHRKLEAIKQATKPVTVAEPSVKACQEGKAAALQQKLDMAKEANRKSASLQKKLDKAKEEVGKASASQRMVGVEADEGSESMASKKRSTTVSKAAILQRKLNEATLQLYRRGDRRRRRAVLQPPKKKKEDEVAEPEQETAKPSLPKKVKKAEDPMTLLKQASSKAEAPKIPDEEAAEDDTEKVDKVALGTRKKKREDEASKGLEEPCQEAGKPALLKRARKVANASTPDKAASSCLPDGASDIRPKERGARPKAIQKQSVQKPAEDSDARTFGEQPFNVFNEFREKAPPLGDSSNVAEEPAKRLRASLRPTTPTRSPVATARNGWRGEEEESDASDSSPSEPSRWRCEGEDDTFDLRDWRRLEQPIQASTRRSQSEDEEASPAAKKRKPRKKKKKKAARGAVSSAEQVVQSRPAAWEPTTHSLASKKDRPKRTPAGAGREDVEEEQHVSPKGKRTASSEATTPKRGKPESSPTCQVPAEAQVHHEAESVEDIMSVSSGSDHADYGVIDCRFISENDAALGLRRRIQRNKARALEEAKKEEKKAKKKAKKAAKRALKAKRKADSAEAAAGCRQEDEDPMWAKLMELSQEG